MRLRFARPPATPLYGTRDDVATSREWDPRPWETILAMAGERLRAIGERSPLCGINSGVAFTAQTIKTINMLVGIVLMLPPVMLSQQGFSGQVGVQWIQK
jgi:hypothetical protein